MMKAPSIAQNNNQQTSGSNKLGDVSTSTIQHNNQIIQGRGGWKTVVTTMTGMEGQHSREGGIGGKLQQSGRKRTIINCRMAHWWIEPCIA
jgi:hypothetical protein